ncbi:hypothetical protein BpHYR1_029501, partial [Brachionus plicatilis]
MEDDLDILPDVSLSDNINSSPSLSCKKNHSQSPNNAFKRINDFREKIKQFTQYAENKKEMDNIINGDGVHFDNLGQVVSDEEISDNIRLDDNQLNLLNKLDTCVDPLISYKPILDQIFSVQSLQADSYLFPMEFFSNNFKTTVKNQNHGANDEKTLQTLVTNQVDPIRFYRFFEQIPKNDMKKSAIDLLLLNCLTQKSSVKIISVFGTLNSMLLEEKLDEVKWHFGAELLFTVFKFLGLNKEKMNEYFKNVSMEKFNQNSSFEEVLKNSKNSSCSISHNSSNMELILTNLMTLLMNSLHSKKSLYAREEIDFIFCLLCLIILDSNYNKICGVNPDMPILFSSLFEAYNSESIEENMKHLSSIILTMVEEQIDKNKENFKQSNFYHRIIYLISFLPNDSSALRMFKGYLTMGCVCLLLNNFRETKIPISDNIADLINQLNNTCQFIFSKSSYSMYNLIEFLNIILDDLVSNIGVNKQNIIIVENIKAIVSEANRMVREAMELQGRAQ